MNGPFGQYQYTTDANAHYRVRVRASNATVGGFPTAALTVGRLPRGLKMRYVLGVHLPTGETKKIYCATRLSTVWRSSFSFNADGLTFRIIERRGERRRLFS